LCEFGFHGYQNDLGFVLDMVKICEVSSLVLLDKSKQWCQCVPVVICSNWLDILNDNGYKLILVAIQAKKPCIRKAYISLDYLPYNFVIQAFISISIFSVLNLTKSWWCLSNKLGCHSEQFCIWITGINEKRPPTRT